MKSPLLIQAARGLRNTKGEALLRATPGRLELRAEENKRRQLGTVLPICSYGA
jgi:hypothetical protein